MWDLKQTVGPIIFNLFLKKKNFLLKKVLLKKVLLKSMSVARVGVFYPDRNGGRDNCLASFVINFILLPHKASFVFMEKRRDYHIRTLTIM